MQMTYCQVLFVVWARFMTLGKTLYFSWGCFCVISEKRGTIPATVTPRAIVRLQESSK